MVTVTDSAVAELKRYMAKNNITNNNLRVYISGLGWGGPQLSLAQDEIKQDDTQFKTQDFNFLLDNSMIRAMHSYGNVKIDFQKSFWGSSFEIRFDLASAC